MHRFLWMYPKTIATDHSIICIDCIVLRRFEKTDRDRSSRGHSRAVGGGLGRRRGGGSCLLRGNDFQEEVNDQWPFGWRLWGMDGCGGPAFPWVVTPWAYWLLPWDATPDFYPSNPPCLSSCRVKKYRWEMISRSRKIFHDRVWSTDKTMWRFARLGFFFWASF